MGEEDTWHFQEGNIRYYKSYKNSENSETTIFEYILFKLAEFLLNKNYFKL